MEENQQSSPDILIDEHITREYNILRKLGSGGMGDVYLAEQLRVGRRPVALKVLNLMWAENPQIVKRFEAEAATAGRIHHRNVVTIYESRVTENGRIYVAMEYVSGQALRDIISKTGRMALGDVIEILEQVCAGVGAAHKLGIVHRDIKPDNIMVSRDDEGLLVKVLDFGIARLSETQTHAFQTRPGLLLGTPAYMSPEQAAGAIGDQIDARSDIYSLGMMVYEMITGTVAFSHKSWLEILHNHLYDPPKPPGQMCVGLPPAVDQIVMRALAKDRKERPQTAAEFYRLLAEAAAGAPPSLFARTTPVLPPEETLREFATAPEWTSTEGATTNIRPIVESRPRGTNGLASDYATVVMPPAVPTERRHVIRSSRPPIPAFRKKLFLILASALALLLIGVAVQWRFRSQRQAPTLATTGATSEPSVSPPALTDALSYQVKRDRTGAGKSGETVPLDLRVRSGEDLWFEFKLARPGALYLFHEEPDRSWRWIDAAPSGRAPLFPAGRVIVTPKDYYYHLDDQIGEEKFILIYVPDAAAWSLPDAITPATLIVSRESRHSGTAGIEASASERLGQWLEKSAVRLVLEARQSPQGAMFHLLRPGDPNQPAFARITLNHTAKE